VSFVSLAQFKWGVKFVRLGKDIATAIQTGNINDWIAASSPIGGMLGDLMALRMEAAASGVVFGDKYWESSKDFYKEGMAEIIARTLLVIALLEFALLGFGKPEAGKDVLTAGDQFNYADENLVDALPGDKWQGKAAMAYAGQVAVQRARVQKMKNIDSRLALEMAQEAGELKTVRNVFSLTQDSLSVCIPIAMYLLTMGPPWPNIAKSVYFQYSVCGLALGDLTHWVQKMIRDSNDHANNVDRLTAEYNDLAASAADVVKSGAPQALRSQAPESSVSSFAPISASLSEFAMPDIATLARSGMARAGAPQQDQQASTSAVTPGEEGAARTTRGVGAGAGEEGAGVGEEGAPLSDTWTPTLSQMNKALGPLSQMSGPASQAMSQLMQQVQQLASMGQQAAAAPAKLVDKVDEEPADEEATLAGDERAPAEPGAAGAQGAERAPIEVAATGAQQARGPSPGERVL
jgi:hypothetical protein